jgi:predicted HTH transcriptional regulator
MLNTIESALFKYIDVATETKLEGQGARGVLENVPANVPVNVTPNKIGSEILALLGNNPTMTAIELARALSVSHRTIKRHIKILREQGRLQRVGSDKTGHWQVLT